MSTTTFITSTGSTNTMPTSTSTVAVGMDIGSCNARIATFDTNLQHPVVAANHDGHRETKVLWSSVGSMLGSGGADLVDSPTTTAEDATSRMGMLEQQQQQQQELQPVTTAEQLKGFVQSKLLTLAASSAHTKDLSIVASIPNDYHQHHDHDQQDNGGDGNANGNGNGAESDDSKPTWWLSTLQQSMNCAVITEAAAIVLAYRVDPCRYRHVLILDGGASSFKATVLTHAGDGLWRQVHFAKLASVHGPALVEPLAQAVAQQFEQQNRRAIPGGRGEVWQSKKARMKLLAVCEQALSHFQRLPSVAIHVDGLYDGIDCNVTMSKPKWEHLSRPLANQVKAFCQRVVMDVAKIEGHPCPTIDTVLIAGNLHDWIAPIVKETLGGDKLHPNMNTLDPSEAIALGCTYQSFWNLQSQQSQQQQSSSSSSSSSPKFGNKDDNKENTDRNKQDDDFLLSKNPTLTVVCSPVEIGIQQQQQLSQQEEQSTSEHGHDAHVASSSTASSSSAASATTTLTTLIAKGTPLPCQVEYEIVHNSDGAAATIKSKTSIFQLVQTVPTFKVLMQLDVNDNDDEEEDPEHPNVGNDNDHGDGDAANAGGSSNVDGEMDTTTTTTTTRTTHLQLQLSVQGRLRIQINKEESYYLE